MAAVKQAQTKVLKTVPVKGLTVAKLVTELGKALGSPISGKDEGAIFPATLTGNIEIREFADKKGAYFTTLEGYSIKVNASFNPAVHINGKVMNCVCRVFDRPEGGQIKFCAFVD